MYSVIVPLYRNSEFVPLLIAEFGRVAGVVQDRFRMEMEFVFVVDGSPDDTHELLRHALPTAPFKSQLLLHARNFGSFAAIRTGLGTARGNLFAVIAGDLQDPPELLVAFLEKLADDGCDIVVGTREARDDPPLSRFLANLFWGLYRKLVIREIPKGGVDLFACNQPVRTELLRFREARSSLIGQLYWVGFRRSEVGYKRRARSRGKSAWTLGKKINYLLDSVFAFSDLPIRVLTLLGAAGIILTAGFGSLVLLLRMIGDIDVPGYTATVLVIIFFGALNSFGIGVVGSYVWRAYENTKDRPGAILQRAETFAGAGRAPAPGSQQYLER
jgi:glycosyltransferase involved in cell wall biosynthesis